MNEDRRRDASAALCTYFLVGALTGFLVTGLLGLWWFDSAVAMFRCGLIGMVAGAVGAPLLAHRED